MIVIGQDVVAWVAMKTRSTWSCGTPIGIGWTRNGVLVCGTVYSDFNGVNLQMHVASDGSKNWLTREFLWTAFDYPFEQAKVNRITSPIGEGNVAARKFIENIGFTLETTLKGAHPTGDLLIYRMWKADCRFLREPYANLYKSRLRVAA